MVLENQLFAPTLKGVIDFGCAELTRKRDSVLRTLQGKGVTKNRSRAELDEVKINNAVFIISDSQIKINQETNCLECINTLLMD